MEASRPERAGGRPARAPWGILTAVGLIALLPISAAPAAPAAPEETARDADDLVIVDCLLPSKVRRLGRNRTYLAPRKPIRTTALECRIRGGEYTEPDQASLATALEVWLPQAKAGDAEAQYYVGEMFEKGLGVAPDYAAAAEWYLRAAEQDHEAAQINLGYLYEQGLGVEADGVAALNWYRRAAGLASDLVVLDETEYAALVEAQSELEAKAGEVESLEREIEELRKQLEEFAAESEAEASRQSTLESLLRRLEGDLAGQQREVAERTRSIEELERKLAAASATSGAPALPGTGEIDFGGYHALVIGNRDYASLPDLETAEADAREIARLLERKYGFAVTLLIDADRYTTMTALNNLREQLTEEDNLLVYYAGHGTRDERGETTWWQPVDAEPANPANWIPAELVTEHLDLVPAKHVFVIADSAYSGLRTRSSIARLPEGMSEERRFHHIRLMLEKRARLVLTSGDVAPARAAPGASHSRFSGALIEVLGDNDGVLEASNVYRRLVERVTAGDEPAAAVPEFATMRWARNNVADFFFVPGS